VILRVDIFLLCEASDIRTRKVNAVIEDQSGLKSKTFSGDNAEAEAKQWIRENL
jgi:hypothetical protein